MHSLLSGSPVSGSRQSPGLYRLDVITLAVSRRRDLGINFSELVGGPQCELPRLVYVSTQHPQRGYNPLLLKHHGERLALPFPCSEVIFTRCDLLSVFSENWGHFNPR